MNTMTETMLLSAVALMINMGVIGWVYKVMQSNIENQRVYFEREVKDLRSQIDVLRNSESRWIQKYRVMYEHFRQHRDCKHGGSCTAWETYIEKIDREGLT